ncbi:MAG: GIY-YIG nuclease family protein [Jatrophihabitantaceae bacterium]
MPSTPRAAEPPRATKLIREQIKAYLQSNDPNEHGQSIGQATAGVYAFYDYDGEPIYVGQTSEGFGVRIGRHLTGQRSDAVAKFVLDPFEVADIEVWTIPEIGNRNATPATKRKLLNVYESSVYQRLRDQSRFKAVLNEEVPDEVEPVVLPQSVRGRIIPVELWDDRAHADVRIARRASIVARLSQLISERQVKGGLRRTLHLQTQRLNWLTEKRLADLGIEHATPGGDEITEVEDTGGQ